MEDKILLTHIEYIRKDIKDIKEKLNSDYARKTEVVALKNEMEAKLAPIRNLVYGAAATILSGVLGAILFIIFKG